LQLRCQSFRIKTKIIAQAADIKDEVNAGVVAMAGVANGPGQVAMATAQ
jgi:hypothetical protein